MPAEEPITQRVLIAMLFLTGALFFLWGSRSFVRPEYNKLALAVAILCSFWFMVTSARWLMSPVPIGPFPPLPALPLWTGLKEKYSVKIKGWVKCFFGEARCEEGDITIWTVGHFVAYFLIGLYVPSLWLEILAVSVAGALIENGMGFTAKYFLDPIVNLAGYGCGTLVALWLKMKREERKREFL